MLGAQFPVPPGYSTSRIASFHHTHKTQRLARQGGSTRLGTRPPAPQSPFYGPRGGAGEGRRIPVPQEAVKGWPLYFHPGSNVSVFLRLLDKDRGSLNFLATEIPNKAALPPGRALVPAAPGQRPTSPLAAQMPSSMVANVA